MPPRLTDLLHSPPAEFQRQRDEIAALIQCEAAQAVELLLEAQQTTELQPVLNLVEQRFAISTDEFLIASSIRPNCGISMMI